MKKKTSATDGTTSAADVKMMGFKADVDLRRRIGALAAQERRSQSWIIRELLLQALADVEKKNAGRRKRPAGIPNAHNVLSHATPVADHD